MLETNRHPVPNVNNMCILLNETSSYHDGASIFIQPKSITEDVMHFQETRPIVGKESNSTLSALLDVYGSPLQVKYRNRNYVVAIVNYKNDDRLGNFATVDQTGCGQRKIIHKPLVGHGMGTEVGWGNYEQTQSSDALLQATQPLYSYNEYRPSNRPFFNGDSGGGMIFELNSWWFSIIVKLIK